MHTCDFRRVHVFAVWRKVYFSPVSRRKPRLIENRRFAKCLCHGREKLPVGREKLPFGRVKLPFRFGQRPPAMLNLQKCRFAKKGAISMENIVFNKAAGKGHPPGSHRNYECLCLFFEDACRHGYVSMDSQYVCLA